MKYILTNILIFFFTCSLLYAQEKSTIMTGEVSYVTSNHIYVKFSNTNAIAVNDTLMKSDGMLLIPCLVVKQKSSSSCVCQAIDNCVLQKGEIITFKQVNIEKETDSSNIVKDSNPVITETLKSEADIDIKQSLSKQKIRGRLSAASYSSLPQEGDDKHRMMYRFSMRAYNINDSKFSVESYLNYRKNLIPKADSSEIQTGFFRVYNLAIKYDVDSTMQINMGRKINYKASSLGAIDGLQIEKQFGGAYLGVITGFRPDIYSYDFNSDLLEYGTYLGFQSAKRQLYSQTTLGFLEQKNAGNVDRRYGYFQHSSTINRKLNLFGSFEVDLYNKVNGVSQSAARLTNLFVSARYRFSRKLNVSVSYDSRKRIIFYETLKTEIERLLEDDEARQGIRFRISLRPIKYVTTGVSFGKRFQSSLQNKSENLNAFINLSRIPGLNGSISFTFNKNSSSYNEGKIFSVRYARSMFRGKLATDFYYRRVNYHYLNTETNYNQNYLGLNLMWRITKKLSLSLLTELSERESQKNYRINTKLIKRFGK